VVAGAVVAGTVVVEGCVVDVGGRVVVVVGVALSWASSATMRRTAAPRA
jgi:hypothetical protein